MRPLRYNEAIVLIMFLVAIFVAAMAWFFYRHCIRIVEAEALQIELERVNRAERGEGGRETRRGDRRRVR